MLKNILMQADTDTKYIDVCVGIPQEAVVVITNTNGMRIEIMDSISDDPKEMVIKVYNPDGVLANVQHYGY